MYDSDDGDGDTVAKSAGERTLQPATQVSPSRNQLSFRGMPYFEELVDDSRLGRIKRQKGGGVTADGMAQVEWEIAEWTSGDAGEEAGSEGNTGKRKLGME